MSDVEELVLRQLRAEGATEHRGSIRYPDLKFEQPTDWIRAIRTAQHLAVQARGLTRSYALKARGEGTTWDQLAAVVGADDEDVRIHGPGVAAFRAVADKPLQPFDQVRVHWDCRSCGQFITDIGPYEGHPEDNEKGHASDCARHRAEVTAYVAGWDD